MFTYRGNFGIVLLDMKKAKRPTCQFGFSFYWVCPLDQGYKYTSGSMLFSNSQAENLFLTVYSKLAIIQSQREWLDWWCFLEETLPGSFPLLRFTSLLFLSKENIVSFLNAVDPVLFISPMNCCFLMFSVWTFVPQLLHLLKLCHWLFSFYSVK